MYTQSVYSPIKTWKRQRKPFSTLTLHFCKHHEITSFKTIPCASRDVCWQWRDPGRR